MDPHSTLHIDIDEAAALWREQIGDLDGLCEKAVRATLDRAAPGSGAVEVSLVLGDDARMQALNREWRGKDKPTNVLSFPAQDFAEGRLLRPSAISPLLLGDIVLAFETVRREAREQGKSLPDHMTHLLVHGVLHLLGFDHEEEGAAERMEQLERQVLAAIGIADPYAVPALTDEEPGNG